MKLGTKKDHNVNYLAFSLKNTLQLLLKPLGDFDENWYKERSHCVDVHIVRGTLSNSFQGVMAPGLSIFSSPELKAQVSFSDCPLSVFRLSVNFYIFDFSRTTGLILTDLAQIILEGREFKFVQMKGIALLQGEIIAKE
jgi:hypothetical protein